MRRVLIAMAACGLAPFAALAQDATPASPAPAAAPAPASASASAQDAVQVLLDQAKYWRAQNQADQAQRSLDRALLLAPGNAEALSLLAQIQAERGDRTAAQATANRLRQAHPDDPHLAAIEQALRMGQIDPTGLAEARRLAQESRAAAAIDRYKTLFRGGAPPDGLAVEYYQTLAATEGGWQAARDGLAGVVSRNPQDARAQLAYAELLTYRDTTRADGIKRLALLAANRSTDAQATKAWQQALQWLPANEASIPAYTAYLDRHPEDSVIAQRLAEAKNPVRTAADIAGAERSRGFDALNGGNLALAETVFGESIKANPQDADALGGLGLVRLRQGRTADARELLARAMAADPAHRDRWLAAYDGANAGQEAAAARARAQAALQRGDLPAAEAAYRAIVARSPNDADALASLATVLNREGKTDEARALLDRAEASGNARVVARVRAADLRGQAQDAPDVQARLALLRAAAAADPSNAWLTLDLARALSAAGQQAEAQAMIDAMIEGPRPPADALQAAIYFDSENSRFAEASALIARLPAGARTPQMRAIAARVKADEEINAAAAVYVTNRAAGRQRLLAIAARPDPEGLLGADVAKAFLKLGDRQGVRDAIAVAQAATPNPTPAQRIAYAGVLMLAGQDREATALINTLNGAQNLTPGQQQAVTELRDGAAIKAADALNAQGKTADAYDRLAPALARAPDDPDLNLALGRLYETAREPKQALAIAMGLLRRDPSNLEARRAAVTAAIQLAQWQQAEALVREGLALAPNDPLAYVISADLARARGDNGRAIADLRMAQDLRRQQLGLDRAGGVQTASLDPALVPGNGNPFRHDQPVPMDAAAFPAASEVQDPLSRDIDKQLAALREDVAPKLQVGGGLRARSGTSGLDQLLEGTVPIEATFSPGGVGTLKLVATPTFLSSGQLTGGTLTQNQFGTAALHGAAAVLPNTQTAQGVGLNVGYAVSWLAADIGSTPLGFQQENIVGGLTAAPQLTDNLRLRVTADRRAVTDSVLSYAGTRDPNSGTEWGGVVRSRGHAQLELTAGLANFYAGGGYAVLTGQNVERNTEVEAGAGMNYPVYRTLTDEIKLGLDLVYFGYANNLRYFTLGQGGYFSPQSYFAALFPVQYKYTSERLTWGVGGSVGFQSYNEHSSPVFPNNAYLQNQLVSQAAYTPGLVTMYPSSNSTGIVGGANAQFEYKLDSGLRLGGRATYQRAGDWNEIMAMLYARYVFSGDQ